MEPDNKPSQPLQPPFGSPAGQSTTPAPQLPSDIYPSPAGIGAGSSYSGAPRVQKPKREGWRSILSTTLIFLLAPLLAFAIAAFVIQSYQVDGQSMQKTLQNHDRLIVDKLPRTWARITGHSYVPHRGDIIVFNQAGLPNVGPNQEKQLIKRVVGLPGDRVTLKDGAITIYNQANPQGFNPDTDGNYKITNTPTLGNVDISLPVGQIFVFGDNRPNSEDSRYFGPVDVKNIVGKLALRLLPFDKLQRF